MVKIPKELIITKIKEKTNLTDSQIQSKVKDKLDQLSGLISEEGALHIIANELGVKILEEPGELQVKNVLAGMRNVEITAKVVKKYEVREFNKNDRKGKVGNFLIGDETGVMRVVAWNDKAELLNTLNDGDVIKINNGYSRDNQGRVEIHLGDKTTVTVQENAKVDVKPFTNERKKIKDLGESEQNVEIMGTMVQVFDPRFWTVDPETGKKVQEKDGVFYLDEKVIEKPDYSYVTNLFLDDGTENIRVVLWKNQTLKLFNMTHEEVLKNKDTGFEDIKTELLGHIVKFVGKTNKNEMFDRVEFVANMVFTDPNPDEEVSRLNTELEKQQQTKEVKEHTESVEVKEEKVEVKETVEEPVLEEKIEVEEVEIEPATVQEPIQEEVITKEKVQEIGEPETVSIDIGVAEETIETVDSVEEVPEAKTEIPIDNVKVEESSETEEIEEVEDIDIADLDSI